MNFKDLLKEDVGVFLNPDEFAETVTYNGAQILATVEYGEEQRKGFNLQSDGRASDATVMVSSADVPDPMQGDIIQTTNRRLSVSKILASDDVMQTLACTFDESVW